MKIVEIKQNWPTNLLRVGLTLGNYCNYKCWYCWPGSNSGTDKFPDLELVIKNLSHVLDYYKKNTNKRKFDILLLGGEPTHWPKFIEFVSYFKENYNCIFTLKTNGSKSLEWWAKAAPYLDQVGISVHNEYVDREYVRNLADYLHSQNVPVNAQVMMDPNTWDECMESVEYFKGSRYRWPIRYIEIIDQKIKYTESQTAIIKKVRARSYNWLWFLKNNRNYRNDVTVIDENRKSKKVSENHLLINKLNVFTGWECNLGVDWLNVGSNGTIIGFCPNPVYNEVYNLYHADFKEKFNPTIAPVVCNQPECVCVFDTNMPKRKLASSLPIKKIIPIKNAN
jgi:MoaA/NifB/PqqE/SkfB family radical SAM enzyme